MRLRAVVEHQVQNSYGPPPSSEVVQHLRQTVTAVSHSRASHRLRLLSGGFAAQRWMQLRSIDRPTKLRVMTGLVAEHQPSTVGSISQGADHQIDRFAE